MRILFFIFFVPFIIRQAKKALQFANKSYRTSSKQPTQTEALFMPVAQTLWDE